MSRSPREYLQHILDETTYIASSSKGVDKEFFMEDETLKRAYVRNQVALNPRLGAAYCPAIATAQLLPANLPDSRTVDTTQSALSMLDDSAPKRAAPTPD
jgi:hypothetical protein